MTYTFGNGAEFEGTLYFVWLVGWLADISFKWLYQLSFLAVSIVVFDLCVLICIVYKIEEPF